MNNRNIKFRVWDKGKKEFLPYPCYLNHLDTNEFTCFDRWFKMDEERCVLQQFTGLFDKNGEAIYEGDLVNFSCDYTADCGDPDIIKWENLEVYYDDHYAGFYFGREQSIQLLDKVIRGTLEVVGNIFETK